MKIRFRNNKFYTVRCQSYVMHKYFKFNLFNLFILFLYLAALRQNPATKSTVEAVRVSLIGPTRSDNFSSSSRSTAPIYENVAPTSTTSRNLPSSTVPAIQRKEEVKNKETRQCNNPPAVVSCSLYYTGTNTSIGGQMTAPLSSCIVLIFSIMSFVCILGLLIIMVYLLLRKKILLSDGDMARIQRNFNLSRRPSTTSNHDNNLLPMHLVDPQQNSPSITISTPRST